MPNHYGNLSVRDYSGELSRFTVAYSPITAVNLGDILTQWGALRTATENIILGEVASEQLVLDNTKLSANSPANPFAQRELKIQVSYTGNTTQKIFQIEIPCPDLNALTLNGTDQVVINDGGVMEAWKTAFETIAKSPDDPAESVTVQSAEVKGRNI